MRRRPSGSAVTRPSCCRKRSFAHRLVCRHGNHVDGEHHAAIKVGQLQNHAVFDVAGVVLEKQNPAILISHFEIIPVKFQAVRADRILEIVSAFHGGLQIERKRGFLRAEKSAQHLQPGSGVQLIGGGIEPRELGGDLAGHAGEKRAGFIHGFLVDGHGQIALLLHACGAAGDFIGQHPIELVHKAIKVVPAVRKQHGIFKGLPVDLFVADRKLGSRTAVQRVQKFTVTEEHGGLVLFRGDGIVDV